MTAIAKRFEKVRAKWTEFNLWPENYVLQLPPRYEVKILEVALTQDVIAGDFDTMVDEARKEVSRVATAAAKRRDGASAGSGAGTGAGADEAVAEGAFVRSSQETCAACHQRATGRRRRCPAARPSGYQLPSSCGDLLHVGTPPATRPSPSARDSGRTGRLSPSRCGATSLMTCICYVELAI